MKDPQSAPAWATVPISELALLVTKGTTPTSVGFDFVDEGVNFIKVESISSEGKFLPNKFAKVSCECHDGLRRSQLAEGDILFSIAGALGRTAAVQNDVLPANINQALAIIRLKPDVPIDRRFALYALSPSLMLDQIEQQRGGVAQQNLSLAQVKEFRIPLPPMVEQKRIVTLLDQAFAALDRARAHAEANLADSIAVFNTTLHKIFRRDLAKSTMQFLPDVCTHFGRGKSKHRPRNDPKLYGGEIPFIQTGDISRAEHLIDSYSQTYSELGLAQSMLWPKGTVCIAIVGATIGQTGILGFDACFPDSVIGIRPDPSVCDPRYVEFMLQAFKDDLKEDGKGSARDNINLETFKARKFPVPELSIQMEIVEKLLMAKKISGQLERIYTQKKREIANLRQSLLQKAFSGQLT